MTHSPTIERIDTVRAYYSGPRIVAEVDIVIDRNERLEVAHDIAEDLQIKLEKLPSIERAYVHIDYETSHKPVSWLIILATTLALILPPMTMISPYRSYFRSTRSRSCSKSSSGTRTTRQFPCLCKKCPHTVVPGYSHDDHLGGQILPNQDTVDWSSTPKRKYCPRGKVAIHERVKRRAQPGVRFAFEHFDVQVVAQRRETVQKAYRLAIDIHFVEACTEREDVTALYRYPRGSHSSR